MGCLHIDRLAGPPRPLVDDRGALLVPRCRCADGVWSRALGLLGTAALDRDQGLWLARCRAVHTCGMRYPIDVVFVDACGAVVRALEAVPPWRFVRAARAAAAIEAGAGALVPLLHEGSLLALADFPAPSAHARAGRG